MEGKKKDELKKKKKKKLTRGKIRCTFSYLSFLTSIINVISTGKGEKDNSGVTLIQFHL